LGGANTYSGTTTVSSGTLLVNGQIGAGNVSVLTGGTLGGNGTLGGRVTVAAGGTLAPGNGLGTYHQQHLGARAGSFTSVTIDKTTAASSQVAAEQPDYGGTLVVTNLAGTLTTSDAFKLFSSTAYAGTFAAITPAVPGPGLAWNTNTLATDGTLRIVVGIANNPTKLSASVVAGNNLQIFWPYDIWVGLCRSRPTLLMSVSALIGQHCWFVNNELRYCSNWRPQCLRVLSPD